MIFLKTQVSLPAFWFLFFLETGTRPKTPGHVRLKETLFPPLCWKSQWCQLTDRSKNLLRLTELVNGDAQVWTRCAYVILSLSRKENKSVNGQVLSKCPGSGRWQAVRYLRRERWLPQEWALREYELRTLSKPWGIFGIVLIGCESSNSKSSQVRLHTLEWDTNYPVDKTGINALLPFILKEKFLHTLLRTFHWKEVFLCSISLQDTPACCLPSFSFPRRICSCQILVFEVNQSSKM